MVESCFGLGCRAGSSALVLAAWVVSGRLAVAYLGLWPELLWSSWDRATNSITCNIGAVAERPLTTSFILFSKTSEANTSSLTGYYLYTQLRNNSTEYAELFSIGTELFESSK